ncbi:MAG: L,D-transpeptidase [Actinobacteria bacterium]|nr:L,D-transpeptidase [Actinomycetota bacterium]
MPSQFDRLSDSEAHRQVGTTLGHAAGRVSGGRRRTAFVLAGLASVAVVVALAAPSALAGNAPAVTVAAAPAAVNDAAKATPVNTKPAKPAKPTATSNDDVGEAGTSTPTKKASSSTATKVSTSNNASIPATESSYAKNIPAYPPDGRHGRRIVYSKALMHVWIVNSKDEVVRDYPVTGRWDRPAKGTYHVYSMSTDTMNEHSKVTFQHMVRFAWGFNDTSASIGFHSIPIYYADNPERGAKKGDRMSGKYELGLPVASGGCVRQDDADAEFLYRWSEIGDLVVVLPTSN